MGKSSAWYFHPRHARSHLHRQGWLTFAQECSQDAATCYIPQALEELRVVLLR